MKSLLLLLLIPFASTPVRYRQLTWADFKGKPTNDHLASTCSGIVIESDTAYAVFEPDKSWTRTNDVATLRHEQLHFSITKKFAEFVAWDAKTNDESHIVWDLQEWSRAEEAYDSETNHGQDTAAQRQWEEKIKL